MNDETIVYICDTVFWCVFWSGLFSVLGGGLRKKVTVNHLSKGATK